MKKAAWAAVFVLLMTACPYSMSPRLKGLVDELHIVSFENRTREPYLGHEITRYLKDEILSRTSMKLSLKADGAVLRGSIRTDDRSIIGIDGSGTVRSERTGLEVKALLRYPDGTEMEIHVVGTAVADTDTLGARDQLLREAAHDAVRKIVDRLIDRGNAPHVRQ